MTNINKIPVLLIFSLILFIFIMPFFAPYPPLESHLEDALNLPNLTYLLGTDSNGRDILSQIFFGARISLSISFLVVLNCLLTGIVIGFFAGYYGGVVDRMFLIVSDVFQAFPGILLAIAVAAFIEANFFNLVVLLSFVGWVSYARVVRAQVLEMKTREFILAGKSIGVGTIRLLFRHFIPNMMGPLIVQASFGMAGVILAESTLSFLGIGLPANVPSLGKLMDSGVSLLLVAPHVSIFPGFVIMGFVLLFNICGEWLRDRLV